MQDYQQHSQALSKINQEPKIKHQPTFNQGTPITVDTNVNLLSAFKSDAQRSYSNKSNQKGLVDSKISDCKQTACILDMTSEHALQMQPQTSLPTNLTAPFTNSVSLTSATQLKQSLSNNFASCIGQPGAGNESIASTTPFQIQNQVNMPNFSLQQLIANIVNRRNSNQMLNLSSVPQDHKQNQPQYETQPIEQKHNLCDIPTLNTQFQKNASKKPQSDIGIDLSALLQSRQISQSQFQKDNIQKNTLQEDTNASLVLTNKSALIRDKNNIQSSSMVNQQTKNQFIDCQPISPQASEPTSAKLKQEAKSLLQSLTSRQGLGASAGKQCNLAQSLGMLRGNKISQVSNPTSLIPTSQIMKPADQGAAAIGSKNQIYLAIQQILENKKKGLVGNQPRIFDSVTQNLDQSSQMKVRAPNGEQESPDVVQQGFIDRLVESSKKQKELSAKDIVEDIKQNQMALFDQIEYKSIIQNQQQQAVLVQQQQFHQAIQTRQEPIQTNMKDHINIEEDKASPETRKRDLKSAQKSKVSGINLIDDDIEKESVENSNDSPSKSQAQSKTFQGIPAEWHRTIKWRNPKTQRIKLMFECLHPGCGSMFKKSCNLRDHFRKHTGARPFSCSVCHKEFTQSGNLGRHLKNVHNITQRSDLSPSHPQSPQDALLSLGKRVTSLNNIGQLVEACGIETNGSSQLCIQPAKRRRQSSVDIQNTQNLSRGMNGSECNQQMAVAPQLNLSFIKQLQAQLCANGAGLTQNNLKQ